jgi:hypothetical protein
MKTSVRNCGVFPAFPFGPEPFYGQRAQSPRARRAVRLDAESPTSYRARHLCRMLPEVHLAPRTVTLAAPAHLAPPRRSEDPLVIALLVALVPPVGVPLLWASPRFSTAGKIGTTAFVAFAMLLGAIVLLAGRGFCV